MSKKYEEILLRSKQRLKEYREKFVDPNSTSSSETRPSSAVPTNRRKTSQESESPSANRPKTSQKSESPSANRPKTSQKSESPPANRPKTSQKSESLPANRPKTSQKSESPPAKITESRPRSSKVKTPPVLNSTADFVVNGNEYMKIGRLGKGGSCTVYQCTSKRYKDTVAVKVVELENQPTEVVNGYVDEVRLLERLQRSKCVVKLYDYEPREDYLYVVMEKGDTDFLSYLNEGELSISSTKHYFSEMLRCVQAIHEENIIHADLKPANFLLVKGRLKLIDFGIASLIRPDETCVQKGYQAGTLNYMSPESFNPRDDTPVELRKAADIWSLGCILYLMVFRHPPYAHYKNKEEAIRMGKEIDFKGHPDALLIDAIKKCMTRDFRERPTAEEMLKHPFVSQHTNDQFSFSNNSSNTGGSFKFDVFDENFINQEAESIKQLNLTPRSTVRRLAERLTKNI